MEYILDKALVKDIKGIHGLLMGGAQNGLLLPRPLSDLYNHTRDFFVLRQPDGQVVGCCALSIIWEDLAEIRSLFVHENLRNKGCGRMLAEACMEEAKSIGMQKIFTLTYETAFFARLNFVEVGKDVLPQKIWADCIHCPKFPDCDEVAMLRTV